MESEEVDYTDDTEPATQYQIPIQYAISPEDAEEIRKNMSIEGRLGFPDFLTDLFLHDNTEKGKKERQKQVRYLHKTEDNKWKNININTLDGDIYWNKTGKLKVLIHGLTSDIHKSAKELIRGQYMFKLGETYIQAQNPNVIVVDWTPLSKEPRLLYYEAVSSTRYAGEAVAEFLIELMNQKVIFSWKDVHIIGHSLGSHVAGVAGFQIYKQTNSKVGRITGLDPAGPLFDFFGFLPLDTSKALDKSDADFVDILHCNMGSVVTTLGGALGSTVVAGSVDFYPNGGERQENRCTFNQDQFMACSHQTSVKYFIESINNPVLACPCADWESYSSKTCTCTIEDAGTIMGDGCSESASGKYYLEILD
ncbi:unnamed protein product [Orchesella dallaii]|uniref:Lipase domain-containing protein n=1 Tax=Orchesella dallaii TaxID=48710 RepID=A0ABP1R0B3_9HEXA